jgi:hypothetical protein
VLRARYYPDGKLLKARMKSGSLYRIVSRKGAFGEWKMVHRLIFGRIAGFLLVII